MILGQGFGFIDLKNEKNFPVQVWAIAKKD